MPSDPHAVQILVDGSSYPKNKRRSGYGAIVFYPDNVVGEEMVFQGFWESTINRMELSACIEALTWVKKNRIGLRYSRVQVSSDSKYVIDNIPRASNWQRAKWRNFAGRPVENSDLWKDFLAARSRTGVRVDFVKVTNKSTPQLKQIDQLAKAAARSNPKIDRGLVTGKIGRAKIKGSARMYPAAGQRLVIRIVGSRVVGKTKENRFVFEEFDESSSLYLAKYFAYCEAEIGSQLHRQRGFRVRMNANPDYPQILDVLEEVLLPKSR